MALEAGLTGRIMEGKPAGARTSLCRSLWAGPLYLALWGWGCAMAGLSTQGAMALVPGAVIALLLPQLKERRQIHLLLLAGVGAALAVWLLGWPRSLDGGKVLLNRLFAASEARQAYSYEKFVPTAPEGEWLSCARQTLAGLGLLSGLVCGGALRKGRQWLALAPAAGLGLASAYLGVTPGAGWCMLLAAALVLALTGGEGLFWRGALLAALALLCGAVFLFSPGEDKALSAWEEGARDTLAVHTAAYGQRPRESEPPEEQTGGEQIYYEEEETAADLGGDELTWTRPMSALLVIALFALLLFLPAIAADRLKKRRAENRRGMEDPDNAAAVRAAFAYSLRWLRLGGLRPENVPFSGYAGQVEAVFSPALRAGFEGVLPLWQEAAYSDHPLDGEKRTAMLAFAEEARQAVWSGLDRRGRFLAKYVYAL